MAGELSLGEEANPYQRNKLDTVAPERQRDSINRRRRRFRPRTSRQIGKEQPGTEPKAWRTYSRCRLLSNGGRRDLELSVSLFLSRGGGGPARLSVARPVHGESNFPDMRANAMCGAWARFAQEEETVQHLSLGVDMSGRQVHLVTISMLHSSPNKSSERTEKGKQIQ
jgi:hypothetical protein